MTLTTVLIILAIGFALISIYFCYKQSQIANEYEELKERNKRVEEELETTKNEITKTVNNWNQDYNFVLSEYGSFDNLFKSFMSDFALYRNNIVKAIKSLTSGTLITYDWKNMTDENTMIQIFGIYTSIKNTIEQFAALIQADALAHSLEEKETSIIDIQTCLSELDKYCSKLEKIIDGKIVERVNKDVSDKAEKKKTYKTKTTKTKKVEETNSDTAIKKKPGRKKKEASTETTETKVKKKPGRKKKIDVKED